MSTEFVEMLSRPAWFEHAACSGLGVLEMFHPDRGQHHLADDAKKVCAVCPVREECLMHALENNEEFGVWGGMTARQRRKERKRRGLARVLQPVECGTYAGYQRHLRRKETTCGPCRASHNERQNELRALAREPKQ